MIKAIELAIERLRRLYAGVDSYHEVYGCQPTNLGNQQRDERLVLDYVIAAEYSDLLAENERLKADLADAQYWRERHCTDSAANAAQSGEHWQRAKALEQQVAALREDAERYAFIRGTLAHSEGAFEDIPPLWSFRHLPGRHPTFDAAIDAARSR